MTTPALYPSSISLRLQPEDIDLLATQGFCVIDDACDSSLLQALQQESSALLSTFKLAKISQGGQADSIRRDRTRWLEPTDPAGSHYLQVLARLSDYLNQQLYLGIRRAEAHYAYYDKDDFYKLHRDNPASQNDRVISTVFYLNDNWVSTDAGELRLQDSQQQWHHILPQANRLVIFQSDLLHEVCPAQRPRKSIAGWLRRDDTLL